MNAKSGWIKSAAKLKLFSASLGCFLWFFYMPSISLLQMKQKNLIIYFSFINFLLSLFDSFFGFFCPFVN
jgi:hypothetical protein